VPIFHDVAQYSDEYDRLKLGIPTSSHFHKIITPQGKPSKQWREYACLLIAERILQRKIELYNSPAMERGLIVEADAADWYEFDQDVTVQRVGFITDDDHTVGCSPDRLVGNDGLLEIKAPLPHTQVEYWISGTVNERFWPQLQGQLYVSQRSWVDIVCWHDVLPKVVMRVEPDEEFIKTLDRELQIFKYFIECVMEKIRATNELPIRKADWHLEQRFARASRQLPDQAILQLRTDVSALSSGARNFQARIIRDEEDCNLKNSSSRCSSGAYWEDSGTVILMVARLRT
jgi:hypothetical protein